MADVNISKYRASVVRDGSKPASPGFVVSEGQDPVNPPGTNNYVPYTGATANVELGEYGLESGFVTLDTTPTNTPTDQGTIYWDDTRSTAALIMNGTLQHIGQDSFFYVKNSSGSTIPKGTCVGFAGTDGASGHLLVTPFLANGSVPSTYFMGVTSEEIANGAFGQVMHFGELTGINTSGFTAGALLYASTTVAGGFQTTVPVAPNNIILVAAAVNSKNNGAIVVRPTLGSNINSDEGVKITSPTTGDLLQLQAGGLWENKTKAQILGGTSSQFVKGDGSLDSTSYQPLLTNPVTGTGVSGQVAFWNGTNSQTGDNGLFWDNTNKRLGVGTTAPDKPLVLRAAAPELKIISTAAQTGGTAYSMFSGSNSGSLFISADPEAASTTSPFMSLIVFGAERMRITAAGNVGIGTNSPTVRLDVSTTSGENYIRVNSAANQDSGYRIAEGGTNKWLLYNVAASDAFAIYDNTAVAERLRITSSGNVLIGTTTDAGYKLNVAGEISLDSYLRHNGDTDTFFGFSGNDEIKFTTTGIDRLLINFSGNVGIGTTTPDSRIHAFVSSGSIQTLLKLENGSATASSGTKISFTEGGAERAAIISQINTGTTPYLSFENNGAERLRITSSGNVGIGTSSSLTAKLTVNGGLSIGNGWGTSGATLESSTGATGADGATIEVSYWGTSSYGPLIFRTGNSERWRITSAGILQSNGAQTIQTSTGNLTLATAAGNGDIVLTPNGTGIALIQNSVVGNIARFLSNTANGQQLTILSTATGVQIRSAFSTGIAGSFEIFASGGSSTLSFGTASAERMRITSTGNVGIGTTAPAFAVGSGLEIERDSTTATLRLQRTGTNTSNLEIRAGESVAEFVVTSGSTPLLFSTGGSEQMRITSDGKLLIGTTDGTSTDKVRINNDGTTSYSTVRISNANSTGNLYVGVGGSNVGNATLRNNAYLINAAASSLLLGTSDTTRLAITSSGNVGIGTTTPDSYTGTASTRVLAVGTTSGNNGVNVISGTTSTGSYMFSDSGGNDQGGLIYFHTADLMTLTTAGSERIRITSGGNVLIGTTTDNGARLQVSGTSTFSSSVTAETNNGNIIISPTGWRDPLRASILLRTKTNDAAEIDFQNTISGLNYGWQISSRESTTPSLIFFSNINGTFSSRLTLTSSGNVLIGTTTSGSSKLRIVGLPTSSAGLSSGDVWNDGGTLKIV